MIIFADKETKLEDLMILLSGSSTSNIATLTLSRPTYFL